MAALAGAAPGAAATQLHATHPSLTLAQIAALLVAAQPAARDPDILLTALTGVGASDAAARAIAAALLPSPP
jgi:hypothetical protein